MGLPGGGRSRAKPASANRARQGIRKSIPLVRFWRFLGLQNALSGAINRAFSIS